MKINKCKLCGNDNISFEKRTSCQGFGEYCTDWIFYCKKCGCTLKFAADNFYGREYYRTEEEAINRWNELHE